MKRTTIFFVTTLIFFGYILFQSCKKNNTEISYKPKGLPAEIEEIKKEFTALNYQDRLESKLNDSVNQVLYPNWKLAFQIRHGDSAVYTYIRLRPNLYINGAPFSYVYKNSSREYLLVEKKKGKTVYYKATAMDARDPTIPGFKGDLLLENLQNHKTNVLHFGDEKYKKTALSRIQATDDPKCYYYFTCSWGGVCNGIVTIVGTYGGPSVYSTVTCTYPNISECPSTSWSINHSTTTVDCDDPPPMVPQPPTPDPTGTVGGGYIPPIGTSIPGTGFSVDPIKGHMCGIINWLKVGDAYVANLSGVGIMFMHPQYGIYNFEMKTLCITIPAYYMTNQRGATNAFIANWNWTADQVLAELNEHPTAVPVAQTLLNRFKYLLVQNLQSTNSGSSINFMGPCMSPGVPTTKAQYDCY
ncbi:hypothetical protein SAMN05660909_05032 [Chitinophaga terrae (ex Kim and Jung 2007)]|uniref:Uncharacterized protein n=1 Tax=Chitinophaga terrae (ex Kim and Jung 2007) TaxID=408074 RepID=A0A1H4G849_9BACT|nr:hypothetical protein [Chitinophaga terrae (ex Kim and Jung 2007)]GEP93219.1 hypothetical protein CTE07_48640 [Chitinophaga terrae (ex Kim and Jung 2007)]SEB05785.1 hypothetical protein SAMN05660909_05032 [Chitinophaga terrae (ex Kim and Jung 2007)]